MTDTPDRPGSAAEVFAVFLKLGLNLVRWPCGASRLFPEEFRPATQMVGRARLCGSRGALPVPTRSRFKPGRNGPSGSRGLGISGLAAWTAFTMPSAIALVLFAIGISSIGNLEGAGWLHGLKVAAVAVVALACAGHGPDAHTGPPPGVARRLAAAIRDHGPDCVWTGGAILLGAFVGLTLLKDGAPSDHSPCPSLSREAMRSWRSFCSWRC